MNPDKPVHAQNVPTPTDSYSRQATHEQVAQRAEQIWRERNCPTGCDEQIWFEAESRLKAEAESRPVSGTESRPYVDEPAIPVKTRTKTQDPTDAAVQTRSATDAKSKKNAGKLRSQ